MTLATEDDDLVTLPDADAELLDTDQADGDAPADESGEGEAGASGDAGEVSVSIGGEPAPAEEDEQRAPDWVRDLRKSNREKDRRIRELEAKVSAPAAAAPAVVLGTKPTLAGCEYDEEKFDTELEAWHARKRDADDQQRKAADANKAAQEAWAAKLTDYGKAKTALKVPDFEDAEDAARETFSVMQQGVILNGADSPALLVYALGKNPKKAKELAAISDPVRFAFAVAKLETQLKVTPRKTAPIPERTIRGASPGAVASSTTLDRLRAEADKTGDRTKVAKYMNDLKAAARK